MWFLLIFLQIFAIKGLDRVLLRGSGNPCIGRLEVYYRKNWGLVCHFGWTKRNGEVVCKSLGCGEHQDSGIEHTHYKDPTMPNIYWMDQVVCSATAESLKDCSYVEPNYNHYQGSFVSVKCAGDVPLSLNMNGQMDTCAGVVQFSTQKGIVGICNTMWDKSKANKICQELNCGSHYYIPNPSVFKHQSGLQGLFDCSAMDTKVLSWQCMEWPAACNDGNANVICTKHRRFRLQNGSNLCSGTVEEFNVSMRSWVALQQTDPSVTAESICAHMNCGADGNFTNDNGPQTLTCSDNVKLSNFTSACFGSVNVVINGLSHGVCYSDTLSHELGKVVCRELKCGKSIDVKQGKYISNGWLSNVQCQGDEESLWHCLAKHENTKCNSATVICSDSLEVSLKNGFGRCSGRVELKLGDSWKPLSVNNWTEQNFDVVCTHLKCGKFAQMAEKLFIERMEMMEWELRCNDSSAKLHECLKKTNFQIKTASKQIICQGEKLMFFEGDRPCQGRVRVKSFDGQSDWLDNDTTVCEATQCGSLQSSIRVQNVTNFNCSGSVSVRTSNRCWGTVEVCRYDGCGGLCQIFWNTEHSKMLCGDLGCGEPIKELFTLNTPNQKVRDYSAYCSKEVKNLSMCNFIPNTDFSCNNSASVICTDSVKAKLEDLRDKCAGGVKLFYAGTWMPVCLDSLNKNLQNAVCRELNCGRAESFAEAYYGETKIEGLSGIKCLDDAESLVKCDFRGVEIKLCSASYLKCTGWRTLFLYKKEGPCMGPVYALSSIDNKSLPVSMQSWTKKEGKLLCNHLQCGEYINHTGDPQEINTKFWNKNYTCLGMKDLWDCERDRVHDTALTSRRQPEDQLNIKCGEPPKITLSSKCTGRVMVNKEPVCASKWNQQMSHNLCDSLKCGKALNFWQSSKAKEEDGWYFDCRVEKSFLWQCKSWRGKCNNSISVACQNAVQLGTTKKCGGFLGVNIRDQWEYVCENISKPDVEKVCEKLDCEKAQTLNEKQFNEKMADNIQLRINCPVMHLDFSQCVEVLPQDQKEKCRRRRAEITCKGYVENTPVNVGVIVGVLLGIVGLLGVFSQRKRLLSALSRYSKKDVKDVSLNENEMENLETDDRASEENMSLFEKEDFEKVDAAITNRKGHDEADDESTSSSGTEYDDIEEQVHDVSYPETTADDHNRIPLLPKRPENLLADEVTYEVEIEGKEDYDDAMPIESLANENEIHLLEPSAQRFANTDDETNAVTEIVEADVHAE